ncbi:ankyrin repeat-containing domain protein [Xylaria sp. FL1777]|nr:ankyrin repeat-containing domain protein [Xylaria sp. FL1777]
MSSPKKRFPPNEWLQRKAAIRNLYLIEKRSLDDIVQILSCDNFHPNKHQLEYKLKLWGFNKNVPKLLAQATWRYIGHEIANRKAQGHDSEVVLFGQVQDQRKVEVETRRHYRFQYGGEPAPKPPEGVSILLRLPLRISSNYIPQQDGTLFRNSMLTVISTMRDPTIELAVSLSESNFASLLTATMPELYPGEATSRAKILLRGWSKRALEEQIMLFLFHLSNKALRGCVEWELIIDVIERSGVMSAAMIINDELSTTLLAVREMLFQLSFKAILEPRVYSIANIDAAMPRMLRLIKWLLRSGQPPDIPIEYASPAYFLLDITPLQIAAYACSNDLLAALLKNGANPNLTLRKPMSNRRRDSWDKRSKWAMPPLFLAGYSACQPDDLGCLDLLFSAGATINYRRWPKWGFISRATFLTLVAGKTHERIALDILKKLTTMSVGNITYLEASKSSNAADTAIAAASRGNIEILKFLRNNNFDVTRANKFGLTALHAAAYGGHLNCCKFLLECGLDVDYHDSARPSPIHLACYQNHIEVVKLLHSQGASIDHQLSISPTLDELALKRYFCTMSDYCQENETSIAQLELPIGAALYTKYIISNDVQPPFAPYTRDSPAPLVSYLLHHGVTIPSFVVSYAARHSDIKLLSVALAAGADPNFSGVDGKTPLNLALNFEPSVLMPESNGPRIAKRMQVAKMLLDAGAEATKSDALRAMRFEEWDLVKKILGHTLQGPPPKYHYWSAETILLEAALLTGKSCIIQQVLKRDPGSYSPGALCAATLQAVKGIVDPDIVYQLLQHRDPNSTKSRACLTQETTAIGIAACYKNSIILEHLLAYLPVFDAACFPDSPLKLPMKEALEKAPERYKTPFWSIIHDGCSVLIYALESNTNIMHKLLDRGYKFDWMVVAGIVLFGEEYHMKMISDHPILYNGRAASNLALSFAIRSGNADQVHSLLQVYKGSKSGRLRLGSNKGPLQVAIEIGNSEMFDILIEAGVSPEAPAEANWGMTALQAAAIYNRVGLAKRLIDLKVDVNAPGATSSGRTALEGAAEHGHIDLIDLLLSSGVETKGPGQYQYLRAIGFALLNGHYVAADMLKRHRKLTEEDLSILENKSLLQDPEDPGFRAYSDCGFSSDGFSSSGSQSGNESEVDSEDGNIQGDRDEDESNSANERAIAADDDLKLGYVQNTPQIGRDETLLSYDETNEYDLDCFSDNIQVRYDSNSVLDTTAPSEGIYDFDYPLFGVGDTAEYWS